MNNNEKISSNLKHSDYSQKLETPSKPTPKQSNNQNNTSPNTLLNQNTSINTDNNTLSKSSINLNIKSHFTQHDSD